MTHQYAYRPEDVAKLWGCSSRQIRNMINSGQLEAFRVGKLLRITPAAVEEYERRNAVSVKSEGVQLHCPVRGWRSQTLCA
ncbi:helix-turn-helix domain-containing protein [Ochrobactrum haematophilum]|uniref:Helix-turn-helix domain-containing protein n=1 Tax=Brucella haematophila TaxID=419474 RepID=A0ABX1DN11_9HYPH|nr:helix-turn-helix domain-containing protein [Brucella haematophila]